MAGMDRIQGIHGIRQPATLELDVTHSEPVDALDRELAHPQPMLGTGIFRSRHMSAA
jgi:hypothetical protein